MGKIFIAYSSEDMRFLTALKEQLNVRIPHKIWIANYDIDVGEEWRMEIENTLNQANFFVPLISKSFLERPEPRRELYAAIDLMDQNKLKIIPVIIEKIEEGGLPFIVKSLQYIPYQPFDSMLDKLVAALSPKRDPFSSKEAFEKYVISTELKPEELVELGKEVLRASWPNRNDQSKAAKFVADKLKNRGNLEDALCLYDLIVKFVPLNESVRMARAELNSRLGHYQLADNDCTEVLNKDGTNVFALHRRFWVNQTWMSSSSQDSQLRVNIMEKTLQDLQNSPAAFSSMFLTGSLIALAEGARICRKPDFATVARDKINLNYESLSKINKRVDQIALLKAMRTIEQFFRNTGGDTNSLEFQKKNLEDMWMIYNY